MNNTHAFQTVIDSDHEAYCGLDQGEYLQRAEGELMLLGFDDDANVRGEVHYYNEQGDDASWGRTFAKLDVARQVMLAVPLNASPAYLNALGSSEVL